MSWARCWTFLNLSTVVHLKSRYNNVQFIERWWCLKEKTQVLLKFSKYFLVCLLLNNIIYKSVIWAFSSLYTTHFFAKTTPQNSTFQHLCAFYGWVRLQNLIHVTLKCSFYKYNLHAPLFYFMFNLRQMFKKRTKQRYFYPLANVSLCSLLWSEMVTLRNSFLHCNIVLRSPCIQIFSS